MDDSQIEKIWLWTHPDPGAVWLEDATVFVNPGHWELYNPFNVTNLPNALAKVDGENALLSFIQDHGLLGYSGLAEDPRGPFEGDPISWALEHARAARLALRLIQAKDSNEKTRSLLEQSLATAPLNLAIPSAPENAVATGHLWPVGIEHRFILYQHSQYIAPQVIAFLVNANTKGVRRQLAYDGKILQSQLAARALIEVIWYRLGEMAVSAWHDQATALRTCKECGLLFTVTDRRQQFCPKATVPGTRASSLCGSRYRKRKSRSET